MHIFDKRMNTSTWWQTFCTQRQSAPLSVAVVLLFLLIIDLDANWSYVIGNSNVSNEDRNSCSHLYLHDLSLLINKSVVQRSLPFGVVTLNVGKTSAAHWWYSLYAWICFYCDVYMLSWSWSHNTWRISLTSDFRIVLKVKITYEMW